jgi:hypothetical protein
MAMRVLGVTPCPQCGCSVVVQLPEEAIHNHGLRAGQHVTVASADAARQAHARVEFVPPSAAVGDSEQKDGLRLSSPLAAR